MEAAELTHFSCANHTLKKQEGGDNWKAEFLTHALTHFDNAIQKQGLKTFEDCPL